ncbi:MAG TPA: hypothetical protein VMB03_20785 [Bryobacteraceae bacterium]|nr:hypothetical protein [Bryobacteraceae bacterium]
MKAFLRIGVFCVLAVGFSQGLMAQRGGGGHGGGGGGFHGGGGFGGGGFRGGGGFGGGGFRGGYGGGFRGGYGGIGYGRGFGYGFGAGLYGGYGFGGLGWGGWGSPFYGYWDDPYDYGYPAYPAYPAYPDYTSGYAAPAEYSPSPNVTVIYPGTAQPMYSPPVQPVMRTYDQYGQPEQPQASQAASNGSPIYLIANKDQTIHAAASYWIEGRTLHYVTLQHEEKQVPLDSLDRSLTLQLNRERRVPFQLPQ